MSKGKIRISERKALLIILVGSWFWSAPHICAANSIVASDSPNKVQIGKALDDYRYFMMSNGPQEFSSTLLQEIAGKEQAPPELEIGDISALSSLFMKGAVPIVLINNAAAFYNPFCDIMLVLKLEFDDTTKKVRILGSFTVGGESFSEAAGEHEESVENADFNFTKVPFPERLVKRMAQITSLLETKDPTSLYHFLKPHIDHRALLGRYLFLRPHISRNERAALDTISGALQVGDIARLASDKNVVFKYPFKLEDLPNSLKVPYNLVFAMGSMQNRISYLEPENDPLIVIRVETVEENEKISVSSIVVLSWMKPFKKIGGQ